MLEMVKTVILSGIAKFYPNEHENWSIRKLNRLNLKPRKNDEKYVSQGMILSAEHEAKCLLLTVDPAVPNGCDWLRLKEPV